MKSFVTKFFECEHSGCFLLPTLVPCCHRSKRPFPLFFQLHLEASHVLKYSEKEFMDTLDWKPFSQPGAEAEK